MSGRKRTHLVRLAALTALCASAAAACADERAPHTATIKLHAGDVIRGELVSEGEQIVLRHAVLGELRVARAAIAEMTVSAAAPQPVAREPDRGVPEVAVAVGSPAPVVPPPVPKPPATKEASQPSFFEKWDGSIEAGFNGAGLDEERGAGRFVLSLKRSREDMSTSASAQYNYSASNGQRQQNRGLVEGRNEWAAGGDSPLGLFCGGGGEYDEFQSWDWRIAGTAGISFRVVEEDDLSVITRAGLGGSTELGGTDDLTRAEVSPAIEMRYRIDDRSVLTAAASAALDIEDTDTYRAAARAAWEYVLDPVNRLTLKVGAEFRTDIAPGIDREYEVLEYFTALVIPF